MNKILKILLIAFVIAIFAAVGIVIWAVKVEPNLLIVKKINLNIPNWHSEHNGFKIAVLTDMHIGSNGNDLKKVQKIVKYTNEQKPDIIVLLGDIDPKLIQKSGVNIDEIVKAFKKFSTPFGVVSILGNHDFCPPGIIKDILVKSGITVLEDENIEIKKDGKTFHVLGLRDIWEYYPDVNVKQVVHRVEDGLPIVLLSHNPDIFPKVPENVSLTLSGHHHGGQISLPSLGGLFINSAYGQRYAKGHIVENGKNLYVSSGLGTLFYARLGNIPEIVVLSITKETNPDKYIMNTPPRKGLSRNIITLNPRINEIFKEHLPAKLEKKH